MDYFTNLPEEIQSYIKWLALLQEIREAGAKRYVKNKLQEINDLRLKHWERLRREENRRSRIANVMTLISWQEGALESHQLRYLERNAHYL
jgi:hypothetical protein